MLATIAEAPEVTIDLFAEDSLRDPFDHYRALRDAGSLVRLTHPDVYAMARFDDVARALRAPDMLISVEGVGFSVSFNASRGNNVIQSDGALHRRLRAAVVRPLGAAQPREARRALKEMIVARVA